MAARLDRRFIVIVGVATLVGVVAIGAALAILQPWGAGRHLRRAEAAAAAGDWDRAFTFYGRAFGREPGNLAYLELTRDAVLRIVPETASEAMERYQNLLAIMERRTRVGGVDEGRWVEYLDFVLERAAFTDDPAAWAFLADQAVLMAQAFGSGDPSETVAIEYEVFATSQRERALAAEERERLQRIAGELSIRAPTSGRAWGAIAQLQFAEWERLLEGGRSLEARQRLGELEDTLRQAAEAGADGLELAIARTRLDSRLLAQGGDAAAGARVDERIAELSRLASTAGPSDRLRLVRALLATGREGSVPAAIAILERHVGDRPDDLFHLQMLAFVEQFNDRERARALSLGLLERPRLPVSLVSAWQDHLSLQAAIQIFEQDFLLWSEAAEPRQRAELRARLEGDLTAIARLTDAAADDSVRLRAEAKLDLIDGNNAAAASKFEEILRRGRLRDLDTLHHAAFALRQVGEVGRALQLLDEAQGSHPENAAVLAQRAELNLRIGRNAEALALATQLERIRPDSPTVAAVREAAARSEAAALGLDRDPVVVALRQAETAFNAGDLEGAAAQLRRLRESHPGDGRIPRAEVQVALRLQDHDRARELVEEVLAADPRDPGMLQVRAMLASDDPIERIEQITRAIHAGDGSMDAQLFAAFEAARREFQRQSERLLEGDPEGARRFSELAIRAAESAQRHRPAAEAEVGSRTVLATRFDNAMEQGRLEEALAIAEGADATGDATLRPLLVSRVHLTRGDLPLALQTIEAALRTNAESSQLHRERGAILESLGRSADALAAYGEALSRRPDDIEAIRRRGGLLVRGGRFGEALELMRSARRLVPQDRPLEDAWLDLEGEHGDARLALELRRERFERDPADRRNAVGLARLLVVATPQREDVLDRQGRPRFGSGQWEALPVVERSRELDRVQQRNREAALRIFEQLLADEPGSFDLVLAYAESLRRLGRAEDGEQALRSHLAARGAEAGSREWMSMGAYLVESAKGRDALEAFAIAVERQDPQRREADLALSDLWFRRGNWEQVLVHIDRVAEVDPSREVQLRRVEALTRLGRLDEAAEALRAISGRDLTLVLLEAALADARGRQRLGGDRPADAAPHYVRFEALIEEAKALAPASPIPPLQLANSLRQRALFSGDPGQREAAIRALDQALLIEPSNWPALRTRAEILTEMGNATAAIGTLEQHLRAAPDAAEARRALVELHLRADNRDRAIATIVEGIRRNPTDPAWHLALAELRLRMGRFSEALDSFRTAYALQPTTATLHRVVDMQLRQRPPDYAAVLEVISGAPQQVERSVYLQSAEGVALANTGRPEAGRARVAEAYRVAQSAMAAGTVDRSILDAWFANLRLLYPPAEADDAEAFVRELAGDGLHPLELRWLAELNATAGADRFARTESLLGEALALDGGADPATTARLHLDWGNLHFLQGRCADAIAAFERSISGGIETPQTLNNLAFLLADCGGDPARAIAYIERAMRIATNVPEFIDTYGFVLWKLGRLADAEAALLQSLRIRPTAAAQYHLAEVLAARGAAPQARTALLRAIELGPDDATRASIERLQRELP
jgi:tetratricopeptide (TPR) repeat protein